MLGANDRTLTRLHPQLVDEVVLHKRVHEVEARGDLDLPGQLLP
jgi:hypothetical protein